LTPDDDKKLGGPISFKKDCLPFDEFAKSYCFVAHIELLFIIMMFHFLEIIELIQASFNDEQMLEDSFVRRILECLDE
jgi:hypothetical protein